MWNMVQQSVRCADISAKSAITPCPKKAPEGWTPMRDEITSDWGSAADCTNLAGEDHLPHTGTLPFESNQLIIGGPVQFHHNLQSYFWLAYLITCNCADIQHMAEIKTYGKVLDPTHSSLLTSLYSEKPFTPQYLSWKNLDGYGCCIDPQQITYESMLLILHRIRGGIDPTLDPYPKDKELKEAWVHYQCYFEMGNNMPLLVDDDGNEKHVRSKRKAAKTHPDTSHIEGSTKHARRLGASKAGLGALILLPQASGSGMRGSKKGKLKAKA
ncbi:hypothetical protein BDR07DRAFT_1384617, partial [Suillus spraguei]